MAVAVLKSGDRCKFCRSPHRHDIDALLELRSQGAKDDAGRTINLEYVLERFGEWGVENPTADNVKNHWGKAKHSYTVEEAVKNEADAREEELRAEAMVVFERVLGADWRTTTPSPEQLLELQRALFPFELADKIRDGKPLGITWDQLDRGLNTSTRRAHNEQVDELLGTLAGAIGESARAVAETAKTVREGETVEGEAVEDADVVAELPPAVAEQRDNG